MGRNVWCSFVVVLVVGVCGVSWGQKAGNPVPADGATDVVSQVLQWTAGSGAARHNVYLGTTPDLGPADLVAAKYPNTGYWHVPGVVPGTTYYWRIDEIQKDGVTIVTGDVWTFTAQPFTAFKPDPADGSNTAPVGPNLRWLEGQLALSHHVYFGDSFAAVEAGAEETDKGVVDDPNYAPGELVPLSSYFWRVDEITPDEVVTGSVWSFTTVLPVDDFESYTQDEGSRIYQAWTDGYTDHSSGSTVGHLDAPFVEQIIVHSGLQSMPLDYNNVKAPFYSEAEFAFDGSQDWTVDDVNTLTVHIHGRTVEIEMQSVGAPPVIDGKVDAVWDAVTPIPIKTRIDGADLTGPADASGQFRVLYDSANLYALVDVNDERLFNDSGSSYLDDSVEFYIDADNTKKAPGLTGNARQYTFGWTTTDVQGTNTDITGIEHAQIDTPTGWRIEIKFPWQSLMGSAAPVGKLIGIDCFYNDDDDGGDTRESQIAWHSTASNDWQTPASWGTALVERSGAVAAADLVYVAIRDASNRVSTVVHPDPAVTKAAEWVPWNIPLSEFAGVNLAAVRKIYVGVGDRDNPTPGGTGIIFIDDIYLTRPVPTE